MIIELIFLLLVSATVYSYIQKRGKNFPPGPIGLPLLGHLPLLGSCPHKTLWDWKKTYGPLIGIWFGSYRAVVINDPKLIQESMNMNAFAGRPKLSLFTHRSEDGVIRGIFPTEGIQNIEQRRFTLKTFRDFGYGTNAMAVKVQGEIQELLNSLLAREGEPIQVKNLFSFPVLNALWIIIFGDRVNEDDPELTDALRGLTS
ncbi:unnamed protein product [Allacma fusca]|uniref:Cytochrome P450 n=1 Tax=Allacma fusca TaxID=39272 RepID=A0A8J2K4Z7_9HEXA|nr:unnamed protein product [Allacma fusca]